MTPTTLQASPQVSRAYIEDQLNGLNPVDLLLRVYDVAITACRQGDSERASRALVELISALNFDHREIAVGLFRMYNYCLTHVKRGRFDMVEPVLTELRETWSQVSEATKS